MSSRDRQTAPRVRAARGRVLQAACALFLLACPAAAGLYPADRLEAESARIAPLVRAIFRDIRAAIPEFDQSRARDLSLSVPLDGPTPLYFGTRQARSIVVIPVESVLFLEDFAALDAMFEFRGCDRGWLQSYARALGRHRTVPPPLDAFGITPEDRAGFLAADLAVRAVTASTLPFLVAHQIGHVLQSGPAPAGGSFPPSAELAADRFAMDRFAERQNRPDGLGLYFQLQAWQDPSGGGQHPLAAERMETIGRRMLQDPDLYADMRGGDRARWQLDVLAYDLIGMSRLMQGGQLAGHRDTVLDRDYPQRGMEGACPS
ncbi:hypothetical protein [Poseidonocella sp. HB161398]|uniref:hypothetical protein n=1 Tax=Poseidonocella sp. HB161398 TaxID=2320855 RepID=UPI0011094F1F|nr:hypothetical protein [Poseidonocella sp. HB161398]